MALLLGLLVAVPTRADPAIEALLARLARPAPAKTLFVEVRFSDLLSEPLVSRGELSFEAADRLGKRVDTPFQETTSVHGENVRIERSGRKPMQFNLKRAPELRALLAGFSGLLGGDRAALQRYFSIKVMGSDARWQIELAPRAARMRKRVAGVTVFGAENAARCFSIDQGEGDASVMLVDEAARGPLPQPLTLSALLALCRGEPG